MRILEQVQSRTSNLPDGWIRLIDETPLHYRCRDAAVYRSPDTRELGRHSRFVCEGFQLSEPKIVDLPDPHMSVDEVNLLGIGMNHKRRRGDVLSGDRPIRAAVPSIGGDPGDRGDARVFVRVRGDNAYATEHRGVVRGLLGPASDHSLWYHTGTQFKAPSLISSAGLAGLFGWCDVRNQPEHAR